MKKDVSIQNRMLLTVVVGILSLFATHLGLEIYYTHSTYADVKEQMDLWSNDTIDKIRDENGGFNFETIVETTPFKGLIIDENKNILWQTSGGGGRAILNQYDLYNGFHRGDPNDPKNMYIYKKPILVENGEDDKSLIYHLIVYNNGAVIDAKIISFRYAIWISLFASMILILFAQAITARWAVRPLKLLMKDIDKVRGGSEDALDNKYPKELVEVTNSLNDLIKFQNKQTVNYQHSLGNLAHSLKTPLAVIKTSLSVSGINDDAKKEIEESLEKMDEIVSYQLSVASKSGRSLFVKPIDMEKIATEIAESLEKINAQKGAYCEFDIQEGLFWPANYGDMQELLGNLLENAFKWCDKRILLTMKTVGKNLLIMVEDDGGGVNEDKIYDIIKRGVRDDENVQGHGIGLAIVKEIVDFYSGNLTIEKSNELHGAKFIIELKDQKNEK